MSDLVIKTLIRPEELDEANYFASLFEAAEKTGILGNGEAQAIREELLFLTARIADEYTGGACIISEEQFSELGASVLYQLGIALKSDRSPDKTAETLKKEKLAFLRSSGQEAVLKIKERCYEKLKKLNELLGELVYTADYRSASGDMESYLYGYNWIYAAHLAPETVSCVPYVGFPELSGVEYAEKCIDSYLCEAELFKCFDNTKVASAGRMYGNIEIFGIVLRRAVGLILCGKDPSYFDLDRTTVDYELYSKLKTLDENECGKLLDYAAAALKNGFGLSDECFSYVSKCIDSLKKGFVIAIENDKLSRFFYL